jgi:hypothetical protein
LNGMSGFRGRGAWAPRGRGGYHAPQVFQAKKWVKPGSGDSGPSDADGAAGPAPAGSAPAAMTSGAQGDCAASGAAKHGQPISPHVREGQNGGATTLPPNVGAGRGGAARKWVKGQGASGPPAPPPPPERGRLSVFVGNLDPSVVEDNLWRFFGQAGRVNRYG